MTLRILFVPIMEKGHTNSLIGILQRLQRDGHILACYGTKRDLIAEQFSKAGIDCLWFPEENKEGASVASLPKTAQLQDPKRLKYWCALGISASLKAENVDRLRAAIHTFKPDVMCTDPMEYCGPVAAELEGIPWAAISPLMVSAADPSWRCPWVDAQQELQPMILEKMSEHGVTALRLQLCDVVSPWLNTLFVTEDFAPRSWSGNTHSWFVGPSKPLGKRGDETDFPWSRLRTDVPIVYVSCGGGQSLSFEPEAFLEICNSLSPTEAQFVCAVQGLFSEDFVRAFPPSSIVVGSAPQMQLLEKYATVAVTHGGINTVTECLAAGRPMLVVPIGHEQPLQARAVETGGFGLSIASSDLSNISCRAALLRLLERSEGFAEAAQRVQVSYSTDGAELAASLIVKLGRTKKALPPENHTL